MSAATQSMNDDHSSDETLFGQIASDLELQGYSIKPCALPERLGRELAQHQQTMNVANFHKAGIGRGDSHFQNEQVRTDEICWITGASDSELNWLDWTNRFMHCLNRRLFLGLFSFESHFAHYAPGQYYRRHCDAFRGEANRVLSLVVYLNSDWQPSDGGELILYHNDEDKEGTRVSPAFGTMVTFLSEEFPHEVLPAARDRYSIAGWFRVNTSVNGRIDPPR